MAREQTAHDRFVLYSVAGVAAGTNGPTCDDIHTPALRTQVIDAFRASLAVVSATMETDDIDMYGAELFALKHFHKFDLASWLYEPLHKTTDIVRVIRACIERCSSQSRVAFSAFEWLSAICWGMPPEHAAAATRLIVDGAEGFFTEYCARSGPATAFLAMYLPPDVLARVMCDGAILMSDVWRKALADGVGWAIIALSMLQMRLCVVDRMPVLRSALGAAVLRVVADTKHPQAEVVAALVVLRGVCDFGDAAPSAATRMREYAFATRRAYNAANVRAHMRVHANIMCALLRDEPITGDVPTALYSYLAHGATGRAYLERHVASIASLANDDPYYVFPVLQRLGVVSGQ